MGTVAAASVAAYVCAVAAIDNGLGVTPIVGR